MNPVTQETTAVALPLTTLDTAFATYLQQSQPGTDSRHTLLAAMTSHQFGRGHACLDLDLLAGTGVASLGWDSALDAGLPSGLVQTAATLPWIEGEGSPLVLDGSRLYLRRNWSAEQSIRAAIDTRLQQECAVPAHLPDLLNELFPRQIPVSGEEGATAPAPDWQKVACALAARRRLTLITGGPGTGKTTTVVRLLALLQAGAREQERALRVALAAPTGKAAARLGESIASALDQLPPGLRPAHIGKVMTLHKLLHIRPDQAEASVAPLAVDLVIVDEASMIDLEMMARLLAAVPLSASLILLGDKDQLASVEAGAVMAQLCEGAETGAYTAGTVDWIRSATGCDVTPFAGDGGLLAQQTVMLRHSRRFRSNSGIGRWAAAVNAGNVPEVARLWRDTADADADAGTSAEVDRLQCTSAQDVRLSRLAMSGWAGWLDLLGTLRSRSAACSDDEALLALQAFARFQILCAVREGPWGVDALNRRIASSLGFAAVEWYAGRPVMVSRNDYNLSLMNGDVGLCLPHAQGLRVAFANGQGGIRWVSPSRLDSVETVFAMTVHKSQGSEFDHVCLVLPDKPSPVLTRELLYTGITRSKMRLTLAVPQVASLWRAVESKVLRSGGLHPNQPASAQ